METQAPSDSAAVHPERKVLAACNLCEAICGVELTIEDRPEGPKVTSIRGNENDPLSRGHICPKGVALADVYEDPDRLRGPVKRVSTGSTTGAGSTTEGRVGRDLLGRGARPDRRRDREGDQRARQGRPGHLLRQPQRALPRGADPRRDDAQDVQDPQQVQCQLRRPGAAPVRRLAALRPPAADPDRRHRPDELLPGLRREPDGLQRLADDGARLPQPAPRAEEARRSHGRLRPAAHRDREGRRRAPLRPAGQRCRRTPRDAARALRGRD